MHLNRLGLAGVTAAAAVVTLLPATPAHALTEARISATSCHGFTLTQRGLPAHTAFRLRAFNPANLRVLAVVRRHTGPHGRLHVRFDVSLKGLQRLAVEVDRIRDDNEFGEAGVDLHLHCGGRIEAAPAVVGAGYTSTLAHPSSADRRERTWPSDTRRQVLLGASVGVVILAAGGWRILLMRRGRRRS